MLPVVYKHYTLGGKQLITTMTNNIVNTRQTDESGHLPDDTGNTAIKIA